MIPISSIDQLKSASPEQLDKICNFSGTTRLKLKDDAEPFIDLHTHKYSIHLKTKLKVEINRKVCSGNWKNTQFGLQHKKRWVAPNIHQPTKIQSQP